MIYDGENMFFKDQALSATTLTSDVIAVGPGEASDPMHLVVDVDKDAGAGAATVKLQTSDTSDFSTVSILGEYTSKTYTTSFKFKDDTLAHLVATKVPRGNKGYLRTVVESTFTSGKMTAGLVLDDDVTHIKQ